MNLQRWGIWCSVSGGITGSRSAWLKSNGTLQTFDTEAAAHAEAKRLIDQAGRYGSARFSYAAKPINE